jgi:hypothetical protein
MTDDDKLVAAYLRRLKRAARGLTRAARQELINEIAGHIAEARAHGAAQDEGGSAAARNVLEQLGDPRDIARAAGGPVRAGRPGRLEIAAVAFLLAGGLLGLTLGIVAGWAGILGAVCGWLAGALMLWASPRWGWQDKLLGSLVWPGGLLTPFLLATLPGQECASSGTVTTCTGFAMPPEVGIPVAVLSVVAPLVVAARLLHRAGRMSDPGDAAVPQLTTK